jgi:hypothetical protein
MKACPANREARHFRALCLGLLFLNIAPAQAGSITGTVSWVISRASDGLTYVLINGTASGPPACATGGYWVIKDETSDAGHKQYAMLLDAQASGLQVHIAGTNACTRWSNGEDIDWIQIVSP